jgi:hypothetical protein
VKNVYAAIYSGTAPILVIGALLFFGFPEKMALIDELLLLFIDLVALRYMWRVYTICRVYRILPHRPVENRTRRRLF